MSTNDGEPEENKKKQKQYMWLGFGNYSGGGVQGPINSGNVRADVSIFELFGVKDKPKKEAEETVKPK